MPPLRPVPSVLRVVGLSCLGPTRGAGKTVGVWSPFEVGWDVLNRCTDVNHFRRNYDTLAGSERRGRQAKSTLGRTTLTLGSKGGGSVSR